MPSTQKNKTKKSYLVGTQCTIVLIDLIIDVQLLWIVLGYINPMSFECWKFRSGGFSGSGCPQPIGKMERNRRNRLLLGAFSDVPHEKNLLLTQNYQQWTSYRVIPSHSNGLICSTRKDRAKQHWFFRWNWDIPTFPAQASLQRKDVVEDHI